LALYSILSKKFLVEIGVSWTLSLPL
jgi:hypothetical protein